MKEKQFDPAGNNEKAPAEGIAAVNTHNPGEEPIEKLGKDQTKENNNSTEQQMDKREA